MIEKKESLQAVTEHSVHNVKNEKRFTYRWLYYALPLLIIIFTLGFVTARLFPPNTMVMIEETPAVPHTATPYPATPEVPATPTPGTQINGDLMPTLYIDIAPDDMDRITNKRKEALEQWILIASDEDYVPALIHLGNGELMPARLRLKGDWADHFIGDKWSYRIQLRDDNTLLGMRVLSIQAPSTRSYLNEWLFLDSLRNEGVLAVRYTFVNVVQNGEYKGVYALEEGFSKELYESLTRREGLMIRYNEDLLWRFWAEFENDLSTPRGISDFYIIDDFQSTKIRNDTLLNQQRETAIGQLRGFWNGNLASQEVFDTETTAKFLALTDLWGAGHALQWHNLRYYYNPITTKLEPIAFDTQPLGDGTWVELALLKGIRQSISLDDPYLQYAYIQALMKYSDPAYLDALITSYEPLLHEYQQALAPEYGSDVTETGNNAIAAPWDDLAIRQSALRELLSPLQMVYAYTSGNPPSDNLSVYAGNLLDFPVEIVGLHVDNTFYPASDQWSSSESPDLAVSESSSDGALILKPLALEAAALQYVPLTLPVTSTILDNSATPLVYLETRIWGLSKTISQPVVLSYPKAYTNAALPEAPDLADVLIKHPFLELGQTPQMLSVKQGTWEIQQDLVLPGNYGLYIAAGTKLKFQTDTLLLSRGPLHFEGTADNPIILGPMNETWSGVVVLGAATSSQWSNVIIKSTQSVERDGWLLTGGVTFYDSQIHIINSTFQDSLGEDALNIIGSPFSIEGSTFSLSGSDAFDGDFAQGFIKDSRFIDIASDAIDISGSDISIQGINIESIGDKGISVGESSRLSGSDVTISNAQFGIVSKDLSQVTLSDVKLDSIYFAAFGAYMKKTEYGPAWIDVSDITFSGIEPERYTLVQSGSWINLDQQRIWGSDIDIDSLYGQ